MTVKQDIKMFLDNLSVRDKVEVLKELYKDIAGRGIEGDTQLAHINTFEANLLIKSVLLSVGVLKTIKSPLFGLLDKILSLIMGGLNGNECLL